MIRHCYVTLQSHKTWFSEKSEKKKKKFEPFPQKKPETYESVSHSFGKNFSKNIYNLNNTISTQVLLHFPI